jgi:type I restriction enzyme S subunit
MLALLQNRSVRQELSKMASGTGGSMKNISQAKLIELKLPIAAAGLQRVFQERVSTIRGIVQGAYRAGQAAEQTFQSLLSGVFSEVRAT